MSKRTLKKIRENILCLSQSKLAQEMGYKSHSVIRKMETDGNIPGYFIHHFKLFVESKGYNWLDVAGSNN